MRTPPSVRFVTPLALIFVLAASAVRADVVIPSSVYRRGVGGAEFRSDVRIFNPTTAPVNVTPILYDQVSGQTITKPVETIPPRAQKSYDNIVGTLFGKTLDDGAFGPIRFQTSDAIIVSSSVNNYNACGNGAVSGQWLPGLDASAALKAGTLVQLASSVDLNSGYRTNVVFANPGTSDATVNANVRRGDGTSVSAATIGPLAPNGFKQVGNWGDFPGVSGTNDTNLWLEFTSDQPVLAFASVINNASGDPFAIVMTAEPNVSAPVPAASYTVTPPSPTAGQAATFTDTSSNSPVNRFWAFGDGDFVATITGATTHTYAAPGTYKTALFVDNAFGASTATKDVVVAAAGPTAITMTGSSHGGSTWDWQPGSVALKVGQAYAITFRADPSENLTHGIGGLAGLGITQCDFLPPQVPCTVNFTPTSGMVGSWPFFCTKTECAPIKPQHDGMTGVITIAP
ncbi:MAG: PKD domain-containing protein [Thermoanaerobaculia bacterium]|nr:PKD domain-containing protein [Thermoanaerobaculia bacterium]